jgi:biopolymer transport protein ExbD
MASKISDQQDEISEINVVPLVDIILVVLIIFMVTAPMFMKPSINVNLPKAVSGDKTAPSKLSVSMSADGTVFLNGVKSTQDQVKLKAEEELQKNPEVQAIISADKDVPHGSVVGMMDLIKSIGVKKFAISIEKK